jgi:CRISPR-associated protein Csx1
MQIIGNFFEYDKVEWLIENKKYKTYLISCAISNYYRDNSSEGCKIQLLIPESLVTYVAKDKDEAFELLNDKNKLKEKFLIKIEESPIFKDLANFKFDVLIIQSIGSFNLNKKCAIIFENYVENLISYLIFDLINLKLEDSKGIIFGVSTGLNIYVCSVIEALKTSIVYYKLLKVIQGETGINVKLAFSPPVIHGLNLIHPIQLYTYDAKAFFELPLKKDFNNLNEIYDFKEEEEKFSNSRKELKKAMTLLKLMFNAIKYNAPLTLFKTFQNIEVIELNSSLNLEKLLEELRKILNYINGKREVKFENNAIKVRYPKVNKQLITNIILSLALYSNLREFTFELRKNKPSINQIKQLFLKEDKNVYKTVGLESNGRFLERDLKSIEIKANCLRLNSWISLNELSKNAEEENIYECTKKPISDEKRNFFAHSGFLKKFTYIKKDGNEILLSYTCSKEALKTIRRWLINPSK